VRVLRPAGAEREKEKEKEKEKEAQRAEKETEEDEYGQAVRKRHLDVVDPVFVAVAEHDRSVTARRKVEARLRAEIEGLLERRAQLWHQFQLSRVAAPYQTGVLLALAASYGLGPEQQHSPQPLTPVPPHEVHSPQPARTSDALDSSIPIGPGGSSSAADDAASDAALDADADATAERERRKKRLETEWAREQHRKKLTLEREARRTQTHAALEQAEQSDQHQLDKSGTSARDPSELRF
jgi:hypothetical protein